MAFYAAELNLKIRKISDYKVFAPIVLWLLFWICKYATVVLREDDSAATVTVKSVITLL